MTISDMTTNPIKVAGIAGGVGTTVLATIIGGIDLGTDTTEVDVLVARNDYRCAKALLDSTAPHSVPVVLIVDTERSLSADDFADVTGRRIIAVNADIAIGRADDAGLLDTSPVAARRYRGVVSDLVSL